MTSVPDPWSPPPDSQRQKTRRDLTSQELARLRSTLRTIAGFAMARERADHTLQPTALVHEVLIKILSNETVDTLDETSFKAWATKAIRHHLIDHARRKSATKRGGGIPHLHLEDAGDLTPTTTEDPHVLLQLNEALERLQKEHHRSAEVVRLRIFGGLGPLETSLRLGVSERTVRMDWAIARAWLYRELHDG